MAKRVTECWRQAQGWLFRNKLPRPCHRSPESCFFLCYQKPPSNKSIFMTIERKPLWPGNCYDRRFWLWLRAAEPCGTCCNSHQLRCNKHPVSQPPRSWFTDSATSATAAAEKNHDSAITVSSRSRRSKASLTSKSHTSQSDQTPMTTSTPTAGESGKGVLKMVFRHFPLAKIPCSQYRKPRFNPWLGNWIPQIPTKSLHVTTKYPAGCREDQRSCVLLKTWHSQINTYFFLKMTFQNAAVHKSTQEGS